MGLAILAATVGAARGPALSDPTPVASAAIEAAAPAVGFERAVQSAPTVAASGAADVVAAPEAPVVPDAVARHVAWSSVDPPAARPVAAPPGGTRPAAAHGAVGRRAPPRSS